MRLNIVLAFGALSASAIAGCAADTTGGSTAQGIESTGSTTEALHCVISATDKSSKCYSSFTDAIAAATGGQILDAPADARLAIRDEAFVARINEVAAAHGPKEAASVVVHAGASNDTAGPEAVHPDTTVVLAINYLDLNFSGSTLTFTAPTGCAWNHSYSWSNLGSAWNDQISSFRAFSNCNERLWVDANFGGNFEDGTSVSYVGDWMNDRGSSVQFFQF